MNPIAAINIFLINPNILLILSLHSYIILFQKIKIIKAYPYNPAFFILSTEKSFETFSRHNAAAFIIEAFALNLRISRPLTNK